MQGRVDPSWFTDYWTPGQHSSGQVSQLNYGEQPVAYLLLPEPPKGFLARPVFPPHQPPKRPGFG